MSDKTNIINFDEKKKEKASTAPDTGFRANVVTKTYKLIVAYRREMKTFIIEAESKDAAILHIPLPQGEFKILDIAEGWSSFASDEEITEKFIKHLEKEDEKEKSGAIQKKPFLVSALLAHSDEFVHTIQYLTDWRSYTNPHRDTGYAIAAQLPDNFTDEFVNLLKPTHELELKRRKREDPHPEMKGFINDIDIAKYKKNKNGGK